MRILLILPYDSTYRHKSGIFKKSLQYAPLTLTTLAALVPKDIDVEIKIVDEGVEDFDLNLDADIVGISVITATAPRAYILADYIRKRGIKVVLGGVHPTLMPQEASLHADAVVVGFAEESWPQLLYDFKAGKLKKFYYQSPNLSLNNLPIPRRDLLKTKAYITKNTIMATRGCVNSCKFCVIPQVWGNKYYSRPIEDVIKEIKYMNVKKILFLDPSPIENVEYAKALYKALIPLNIKWAGLSTTRIVADKELFKLATQSGCIGLLIGFETIHQPTLNGIGKGFSYVEQYKDIVEELHDNGITVLGCFMFGFDNDDKSIFDRTVEFVDKIKIDIVRYAVYTPFPGTTAYNELKRQGRIIKDNWALYDNEHVVFKPAKMSPEELQEGLHKAWQQSYTFSSIFKRLSGRDIHWLTIAANFGFRYYAKGLKRGEINDKNAMECSFSSSFSP